MNIEYLEKERYNQYESGLKQGWDNCKREILKLLNSRSLVNMSELEAYILLEKIKNLN